MRRHLLLIPLLAGAGASEANVQIHGFVSQGYVATEDNAYFTPDTEHGGSFDFREVGLNISCEPVARTWVGIQLIGRDLGDIYTSDLAIDWVFGQVSIPTGDSGWEASARAGRIKTGHALYNDTRDLDLSRTTVFLPEVIYWTTWRDLYVATNGLGASLRSPRGAAGVFTVDGFYGSERFPADEGAFSDAYGAYHGETPDRIAIGAHYGAQLTWEAPLDGLLLKLSWMGASDWVADWADTDADADVQTRYWDTDETYDELVASCEYAVADWRLVGEASWWDERSVDRYSSFDTTAGTASTAEGAWRDHGNAAYATVSWRFHPALEVAATSQWMIERYHDDFGTSTTERVFAYGAAVSWSVTGHLLVKAEGMIADGGNWLRVQDQEDGVIVDDWRMLSLRTTFDF